MMNFDENTIIDISSTIYSGMPVYPKNTEVNIETFSTGHSKISRIVMGSHTGTHVDAPAHALEGAPGVDNLSLQTLIGPCRVLDMTHVEEYISKKDLETQNIKNGERILVKTKNSFLDNHKFHENYIYLGSDAALYLSHLDIALFGIDYLSVKKKGSPDNTPHTALLQTSIPIFEGLNLKDVEPGEYLFIGLPLKIKKLDGAPSRVVLIKQ